MKSKIIQQDHDDLIQLNRDLTPQQRLLAFFNHSQLLGRLFLVGKIQGTAGQNRRNKEITKQ